MSRFKIYYSNSVYEGITQQDWVDAPSTDVQVVVVFEPRHEWPNLPDRFLTGFVYTAIKDRNFYTGADEYDTLNYGSVKYGVLLPDSDYVAIWEQAYSDI